MRWRYDHSICLATAPPRPVLCALVSRRVAACSSSIWLRCAVQRPTWICLDYYGSCPLCVPFARSQSWLQVAAHPLCQSGAVESPSAATAHHGRRRLRAHAAMRRQAPFPLWRASSQIAPSPIIQALVRFGRGRAREPSKTRIGDGATLVSPGATPPLSDFAQVTSSPACPSAGPSYPLPAAGSSTPVYSRTRRRYVVRAG